MTALLYTTQEVEFGDVPTMECEERGRDVVELARCPRYSEDLFVRRKCEEDPSAYPAPKSRDVWADNEDR